MIGMIAEPFFSQRSQRSYGNRALGEIGEYETIGIDPVLQDATM